MPVFHVNTQVDVEIDVEFEVWCAECGAGMCYESTVETGVRSGRGLHLRVGLCKKCIRRLEDAAYEKGVDAGREQAEREKQ